MKEYTIKYGEKEFRASEYQCRIFDNVEHGVGNMIISAAAGAAKSTTIINCINLIDENKKILFIAFNKDIVESIRKRVGERKNTKISTFHSLGYSILKENLHDNHEHEDNFINEFKYRNYIKNNIDNITCYKETKSLSKNRILYINNIIDLVEYSRYYLAFTEKEIKRISDKYGLVLLRDEVDVCREVLKWGKENISQIDYTDMIWLPNVLNLLTKKYLFDWILIDEAQDTSIAEQNIIDKCFKRGARFIVVCDQFQQINVWCGSSEEAINNFGKYPNTNLFTLPITYRCPKKVVDLAKNFSDNIVAADNAIDGEIKYGVSKYSPTSNDMVLCRNTAPLVDLHLQYIRVNKKSYVMGFDNIKEKYIQLINSTSAKIIDKNCITKNGLFPKMYEGLLEQIDIVKRDFGLDDDDAIMHTSVYSMFDTIEGIRVVSEGLTTVDELVDKINVIFSGTEKDAIQLSTVHKAKGLEADNVFILYPSLMPSKYAKKDWEVKTEKNLMYVAYTRAKKSLNFIEEEKKTFGYSSSLFEPSNMKAQVEYMRKKLNHNETVANINITLAQPKVLGQDDNEEKNTVTKRNKKTAASKFAVMLK